MRQLDHLVYVVPDLSTAVQGFAERSGITPVYGGKHRSRGTENALVRIGRTVYLEILAPDPESAVAPPRWMGVDFVARPTLTRWAFKSENLEKDADTLRRYAPELASVTTGERRTADDRTLRWQMTLPRAVPTVELLPFFCDWRASEIHPTAALPAQCRLANVELRHPAPAETSSTLRELGITQSVMQGANVAFKAELKTPRGTLIL